MASSGFLLSTPCPSRRLDAERRTQNTERRIDNAECGTQIADGSYMISALCLLPSAFFA